MNQINPTRIGTITKHLHGFVFEVQLDDGTTTDAAVKRHTARIMWRIAPGDRVRLGVREGDEKRMQILGHDSG